MKFSVIIPAYNYADHLPHAVNSVLNQTYPDFEIIIVDDGSTDNTAQVAQQFTDPRIKYIHQQNKGLPAARNTGIHNSSGELLALLDADDTFHPQKLEKTATFLDANPHIGLAYHAHYFVDSQNQILSLHPAKPTVTLADLVTSYHFAPSDVTVRRPWAEKINFYDESFRLNSEDLNFHIRLALAGCQFAGIPDSLTYRLIHPDRAFNNLDAKLQTMHRALDTAFNDPNCPPDILSLKNKAYANHNLSWAYQAAIQDETDLAQNYLQEATRLNPDLPPYHNPTMLRFFARMSIRDGGQPEPRLHQIFPQFSPITHCTPVHQQWIIAQAYLFAGMRETLWQRPQTAQAYFKKAHQHQAKVDEPFLREWIDRFLNYQATTTTAQADKTLQQLITYLEPLTPKQQLNWFIGCLSVNQAFRAYRQKKYKAVPRLIWQAYKNDPSYLKNRGVASTLLRSLIRK